MHKGVFSIVVIKVQADHKGVYLAGRVHVTLAGILSPLLESSLKL